MKRGPTLRRLLLLTLAGAQLAGCGRPAEDAAPRRIFLVTVDTLRADHLGAYGYPRATSPAIDALAAQSVRFEQALAQWPLTGPSFASMMSGLYPRSTGRVGSPHVSPPQGVQLLAEFLREQGYTTAAVVSNRVLAKEVGWDRGFDEYLETWASAEQAFEDPFELKSWLAAPRVTELALPMLERHRQAEKLFVWLHYSDPHAPYSLPEGFENPFTDDDPRPAPDDLTPSHRLPGVETVGGYVASYDANIMITDRGVGQALDRARDLGLMEDALVIFTADHGESLGEHDYYFHHGRNPYSPSARVPLLIHDPVRFPVGVSVAEPVELIDLYPTLRQIVSPGAPAADLPGSSLVPVLHGEEEPSGVAFIEARHGKRTYLATQIPGWKLVLARFQTRDSGPKSSLQLFDLERDPLETRNVARRQRPKVRELRRLLDHWLAETHDNPDLETPTTDEEMRRVLEALGYLD